jgi:hypothetical protein
VVTGPSELLSLRYVVRRSSSSAAASRSSASSRAVAASRCIDSCESAPPSRDHPLGDGAVGVLDPDNVGVHGQAAFGSAEESGADPVVGVVEAPVEDLGGAGGWLDGCDLVR